MSGELPYLGLRQGMFEGAFRCPRCGFATTDPNVYDCPNCGLAWKEKPKKLGVEKGQKVSLECSVCDQPIQPGQDVVFSGLSGSLAHENCLADTDTPDVPSAFLEMLKDAQPIDGGAQWRDEVEEAVQTADAVVINLPPQQGSKKRRPPCGCPHTFNEAGRITGKKHNPDCPRGR